MTRKVSSDEAKAGYVRESPGLLDYFDEENAYVQFAGKDLCEALKKLYQSQEVKEFKKYG